MTFSTLAPLKPISKIGQGCVASLVLIQIIFCIVALSTTFWTLGFSKCSALSLIDDGEVYVYLLLGKGLCVDSEKEATPQDLHDCTEWENISGTDDSAEDDADKYIHTNGLFASALVFAVLMMLFTGAAYSNIQTDYTNKIRYTQIFLGVLVAALSAGAVGNVSDTFYTDEENYPYYSLCEDSYTTPGAGWTVGFFCVCVAGSSVGVLLFPCCKCVYDESTSRESPPDETYNAVVRSA